MAVGLFLLVLMFLASPAVFAQDSAPTAPNNPSALPTAWANWKYSRLIDLPSAAPAGQTERLVKLRLPAEIFAHAQPNLADLRIIDDLGSQTPYVLRVASGQTKTEAIPSRQLESSFVPGQYTQIILDAGPRAPFYNSLGVPAMLDNFIAWAGIEASDDARTWRQLGSPQPVYRFAQRNGVSELTLRFSPTNARYIRLRIYYKPAKFQVAGISLHHTVSIPREDVPVATISNTSATQQTGKTVFHVDLQYPLPIDRVRIASSAAEFDRAVQIYSSDDDAHWNWTGADRIYKFSSPLPPSPEELASRVDETSDPSADVSDAGRDATGHYVRLACNFGAQPARYWRVEIANGNDAPLPNASAQLSLAARDVFFREELGRSYSLIYGQSQLRGQPSYDLARTLTDAQMNSAFAAWAIGPERVNSAWLDPRPWTERYSIVLWLAVILAALALTLLAIQSLKGGHAPGAPSDT
ncbi:MAG TPA: DUF3999 family protein [Verrucomicrobiae bacterium]|nr:DUF3999 family protein [Verrucomicrobiae bacterium]